MESLEVGETSLSGKCPVGETSHQENVLLETPGTMIYYIFQQLYHILPQTIQFAF